MTDSRPFVRSVLFLSFVAGVAQSTAFADERAEAAAEMEKANAHLEKHEYDAAIARFNTARLLVPSSSGPYLGLGLAYAATDRCREATAYLEEYMHRSKSPKPEATAALTDCKAKLIPPGRIKVTSDPPGADVRIDNESGPSIGKTPLESAELSQGTHRVLLALDGYKPHSLEVQVAPGVMAVVTAALDPIPKIEPKIEPKVTEPPKVVEPYSPKIEPPRPQVVQPLPPLAQVGTIDIVATDPHATIAVNGQPVYASQGHATMRLPPGLYRISVAAEGRRSAEGTVTLLAGEHLSYKGQLDETKTKTWLNLGVSFTIFAVLAGGASVAGHIIADNAFAGTDTFNVASTIEQVGAGVAIGCAAVAVLGYVLQGVLNRHRVDGAQPTRLQPMTVQAER